MENNKYLSLEGLTQYDTLIKERIQEQIDSIDTIKINDTETNTVDTWSSSKIKNYTDQQVESLVGGDFVVSNAEHATSADTANHSASADTAANANYATSAGNATSATKASQDASGNVITSTYETKTDSSAKLTEAKKYTDTRINEHAGQGHSSDTIMYNGADNYLLSKGDNLNVNLETLDEAIFNKADRQHTHHWDDLQGKPFYTETSESLILHNGELDFYGGDLGNFATVSNNIRGIITSDTILNVSFDDDSYYNLVAKPVPYNEEEYYFGNGSIMGEYDSGEPFTLYTDYGTLTMVSYDNIYKRNIFIVAKTKFSILNPNSLPELSELTTTDKTIAGAINELNTNKAGASHTHDDIYYTEIEIDTKVSALNNAINSKANSSHTHSISDVTNLQTTLDGKVPTSRTVNGKSLSSNIALSASDVGADASGSANSVQTNLNTHTGNTTVHITSTERTNWNAAKTHADSVHAPVNAEENQKAFSNVIVDASDYNAPYKTSSLEFIKGNGINISATTSGKEGDVSITITNKGVRGIATGSDNGTISVDTNGIYENVAVKGLGSAAFTASTAYDAAGTAQTKADNALVSAKTYTDTAISNLINSAPTTLDTLGEIATAMEENADVVEALEDAIGNKVDKVSGKGLSTNDLTAALKSNYDTAYSHVSNKSNPHGVTLSQLGVNATSTELNYMDGVTSNVQTQLDGKADSSHTHSSYVNQNAFSNIAVSGQTTVAADSATDTVTFVGSNVSITTDATGDSVTFSVANASTSAKGVVQLVDSATNTATDKAATANAVNTAYTLASTANATANSAKTTAESKSTVAASTTNGNIKINGTETTVYTHPTSAGNKHIPTGGSSGQVLKYSASGTATWGTDKDTTYSLGTGDNNGTIKVTPSSGSAYNVAVKGLGSVAYVSTVPIANGGTGATTAAAARTNLDVYSKTEIDAKLEESGTQVQIITWEADD